MRTNKTNSHVNALTETPKTISPLTEEKEENSAKEVWENIAKLEILKERNENS